MQNTRRITGACDLPKAGDVVVVDVVARLARRGLPFSGGSVQVLTRCENIQVDREFTSRKNPWFKTGALDLEGKEYVQVIMLDEFIELIRVVV